MIGRRMSLKATRDFCRRFGTGIKAGADLLKLLDSEAKHGAPAQREAIAYLRRQAAAGESLAETLKQRSQVFPPLLVSMTRVGEATGRLERTMLQLAEYYEQQVKLRAAFLQAITWPMIQLILGIGVVSLLIAIMGMVTAPTGGQMHDMLGLGLRGGSGVLIFWGYCFAFFACLFCTVFAFKQNYFGLQNAVPFLYRVPMVGGALQTITLARFTWALSLTLDAGLNPVDAILLSLDATDSDFYRSGAQDAENAIREGATLAGALQATDLFPDELITQVEVAELSGTDAESIDLVAVEYDVRAQSAMKTISGFATGLIWIGVSVFLIFMIFRIVMNIAGVYSDALEGI